GPVAGEGGGVALEAVGEVTLLEGRDERLDAGERRLRGGDHRGALGDDDVRHAGELRLVDAGERGALERAHRRLRGRGGRERVAVPGAQPGGDDAGGRGAVE